MPTQRILLYGGSVFFLSVEAILRQDPSLELVHVNASIANLRDQLAELEPTVIVFDRTATAAELLLPLLLKQPALVLIGLDPDSDEALVLAGQSSTILSAKDLSRLVNSHLSTFVKGVRP